MWLFLGFLNSKIPRGYEGSHTYTRPGHTSSPSSYFLHVRESLHVGFLKGELSLLWSKVRQDFALLRKMLLVKETPGVSGGSPCPGVSGPQHPLLLQTPWTEPWSLRTHTCVSFFSLRAKPGCNYWFLPCQHGLCSHQPAGGGQELPGQVCLTFRASDTSSGTQGYTDRVGDLCSCPKYLVVLWFVTVEWKHTEENPSPT